MKAAGGASLYKEVNKLLEEVKCGDISLKEIVIKWTEIIRDLLETKIEGDKSIMLFIIEDFISQCRPSAAWRFMEVTNYRSHVLAAKARADDWFEDRESKISCPWYESMVHEISLRRMSYSLFESLDLDVYPRIVITGKDL